MQSHPQRKADFLFEDEKGGIVRGMGMGVKKVAKKRSGYRHWICPSESTSGRKGQLRRGSCLTSRKKPPNACTTLSKVEKSPKTNLPEQRKRGGEDQKSSRLKFTEGEGGTAEKCSRTAAEKKQPQPPPTAAGGEAKTVGAKFYQKKQYKDAYAAAKRGQKAGTAASKQAAAATNTITEKAKAAVQEIVVQNKTLWVSIGVGILLVMVMLGAFSAAVQQFREQAVPLWERHIPARMPT